MWMATMMTGAAAVAVASALTVKWTGWYSRRRVAQSKRQVATKLAHFQSVAESYSAGGTPKELERVVEELEGLMRELRFIEQN